MYFIIFSPEFGSARGRKAQNRFAEIRDDNAICLFVWTIEIFMGKEEEDDAKFADGCTCLIFRLFFIFLRQVLKKTSE
jgi:hypothetical protein